MRGQTLFVGNLVGEGTGIDFSDGTLQITAYQGTTSEGIIPNQLTIKNSTNSTEVIISAGQDSSGNLTDDSIYYTALNPSESSASLYHNFEGNGVHIDGTLNVTGLTTLVNTYNTGYMNVDGYCTVTTSNVNQNLTVYGTSTLDSTLNVAGATTLDSSLNVSGLSTLTTAQVNSTLTVVGATTLDSYLNVYGATYLYGSKTQIGSSASNSAILYVNGPISQTMLNYNTGLGNAALSSITTSGNSNTAVGFQSLSSNTSGSYNTAVGFDTLANCTYGYGNTAIGTNSLPYLTGGYDNTCIGANTGTAITGGYNNTCLGAGTNITNGAINSTVIGAGATTATSNQICLGLSANNTYIPGSLEVAGSTTMDSDLYVNGTATVRAGIVNSNLTVAGTSTFTSGFACGTQSIPYIVYFGIATINNQGYTIPALVSSSTSSDYIMLCTLDNTFPTQISGCIVSSNDPYVWGSYSDSPSTSTINVSFVNFTQYTQSIPNYISYVAWGS